MAVIRSNSEPTSIELQQLSASVHISPETPDSPRKVGGAHSQSSPGSMSTEAISRRNYAVGLLLLFIVVFLWTSSNFVTQALFDGGYAKPFVITYLNTSAFSFYLLPYLIRKWKTKRVRNNLNRTGYNPLPSLEESERLITDEPEATSLGGRSVSTKPPLTTEEIARLALHFSFIWFIANWSVNVSLGYTSVASATILSSMSGFFTLGVGRCFGLEKLTAGKIFAVFISFGGVVLVSTSDSAQKDFSTPPTNRVPRPLLGDFLALISALFYALYVTLLKLRIQHESRIDMQLFFGFVGLFNILLLWPMGILLHLFGVELFEWPHGKKVIAGILMNMCITLSSDYIYVLAMLKTTPLVVTVGLSLTIPLAVIGDMFLGTWATAQVLVGAILVVLSFLLVGWGDQLSERDEPAMAIANDRVD